MAWDPGAESLSSALMKTEILVATLVGGLAGFAAGVLFAPEPPAAVSAPEVRVDLEPVLAELRALRRSLELPSGRAAGGADGGRPDPAPLVTEAAPALDPEVFGGFLDALDARLADALAAADGVAVRASLPREHDRQAVAVLRTEIDGSRQRAPVAVFGLTPSQVYARYGTPSNVWNDPNGGLDWVYLSEDEEQMTVLRFQEGYVTDAWTE